MPAIVSSTALTAAISAANSALDGAKDAAYLDSLISSIGANYKRVLRRDGSTVWTGTASGSLSRTGTTLNIAAITANASANAAIATGTWTHRIEKGSDANVYIESEVGPTGSGKAGILSADLVSGASATISAATMAGPGFDSVSTGVLTLAQAYATCMTSTNDFPPGNSAGNTDFFNSLWPRSDYFQTSPYGSNIDPMRFGQDEPGVGTTDANYIITRRAASGRIATGFILWPWIMPPKGILNAQGNWRVQIRDLQAAYKLDSLSNSWVLCYGPAQISSYGLNNQGGLRISGIRDDFKNSSFVGGTAGVRLFEQTIDYVSARTETTGGISFKNFGYSTDDFQVELNSPDPAVQLPTNASARVCAFAACYWARIIPDTGSGPLPSNLNIGGLLGMDCYDSSGRVGTPGQSRLVKFDDKWRPVVMAFVLTGAPPSTPMTPAATGTWLVANPPPFV